MEIIGERKNWTKDAEEKLQNFENGKKIMLMEVNVTRNIRNNGKDIEVFKGVTKVVEVTTDVRNWADEKSNKNVIRSRNICNETIDKNLERRILRTVKRRTHKNKVEEKEMDKSITGGNKNAFFYAVSIENVIEPQTDVKINNRYIKYKTIKRNVWPSTY